MTGKISREAAFKALNGRTNDLPVKVTRLNKSGEKSKMSDAVKFFPTIDQAEKWVAHVKSINTTEINFVIE